MSLNLITARLLVGLAFAAVSAVAGPPFVAGEPSCSGACISMFGLFALCAAGAYFAYTLARPWPGELAGPAKPDKSRCVCGTPKRFYLLPAEDARELYAPQRGDAALRGDTGVDLRWPADIELAPGEKRVVGLGVRVAYLCEDCGDASAFWLAPRSSLGTKTDLQLANGLGLIDRGYRGEVRAVVRNLGGEPYAGKKGDALLQLAAPDLGPARYTVCVAGGAYAARLFADGATERGAGGFGSTGAAGR